MTLQEMILALESGRMSYGLTDDYIWVPVATANEIAKLLRAVEKQNKVKVKEGVILSERIKVSLYFLSEMEEHTDQIKDVHVRAVIHGMLERLFEADIGDEE